MEFVEGGTALNVLHKHHQMIMKKSLGIFNPFIAFRRFQLISKFVRAWRQLKLKKNTISRIGYCLREEVDLCSIEFKIQ